ncbi:MAG TPA: HAD family hydrolase [Pseudonocardia sp.]|jgi:HAD superfamily hydrolase (TIGR01509 family)|nr:HAD family hydrolase [Pseudonocardia sp.]
MATPPALLFDLDGTLIDSVYQHVLAWQEALTAFGVDLAVWKIHRRIGMSGGLFVNALVRETGGALSPTQARELGLAHAEAFGRRRDTVRPLPGAAELLATLSAEGVPWAIATSGLALSARPALALLGLPEDTPLVTRDQVRHAKPDPDLFLAAADLIDVAIGRAIVVGDSIWDLLAARRAGALGVGLLSGGYGREELERAGAYRVYADPAELLDHLDEIGVRRD